MSEPRRGDLDETQDMNPQTGDSRGLEFPRRAPGVDLIGMADANGYREQQWLICVDGSRYVQATPRLYHVLLYADGQTAVEEIARRAGAALNDEMTADQVRWLLRERLLPAGLVTLGSPSAETTAETSQSPGQAAAGSARTQPRTPHLGIQHRLPILGYQTTAPITARLEHLYWPPLVVLVVVLAGAINIWLYAGTGFRDSLHALLVQPGLLLVLLALDVPLRIFHEFGHASAMRRAGAPYGEIGVALYFVVPVYYTDVTHAYRLPRWDRVRVDVGGMYFDIISTIALAAAYALTGQVVLLLAIVAIGLNMLREFTPFMRFDGYYLMADLIGVHEPLSLLWPLAADHIPGLQKSESPASGLTTVAKVTLLAYFLIVVAFLVRPLVLLTAVGTSGFDQFVQTGRMFVADLGLGWRTHDLALLFTSGVELIFWSIIPIGLALTSIALVRLGVNLSRRLWLRMQTRPAARPIAESPPEMTEVAPEPVADPLVVEAEVDGEVKAETAPLQDAELAPEEAAEIPPSAPAMDGLHEPASSDRGSIDDALESTLQKASDEYVAGLRALVGEVRAISEEQLAGKDRRIEDLMRRVMEAERERDTLQASLDRLTTAFEQSMTDLMSLDRDLVQRADTIRREWYMAVALTTPAEPSGNDR